MNLQDISSISNIIGTFFIAFSVFLGLITYFRQYIHQQINDFREGLFRCEKDTERLYKEFDQVNLVKIIHGIISHPWMSKYIEQVKEKINLTEQEYKKNIEDNNYLLSTIVTSVIAENNPKYESDYDTNYRNHIDKINSKYPILALFLRQYLRLIIHCMRTPINTAEYIEIIEKTLIAIYQKNDFGKYQHSEQICGIIFSQMISMTSVKIEKQRLNALLESMINLQKLFFNIYRNKSDWSLWFPLFSENRRLAEKIKEKQNISSILKEIISFKIKRCPRNVQFEISVLAGELSKILTLDIKET